MNNFGNILRNGFRRRSDAAHHNEARTALHALNQKQFYDNL